MDLEKSRQCTAKSRTGNRCKRYAVRGMTVCRFHGGAAPQVKKAAERRLAEQAAIEAVKTYGLPVDISPVDALLEEVRWTAGHVAWLCARVQEVEQKALVWGVTEKVDKGSGEFIGVDTTEAAATNMWLTLYQRERKHLVDVCKAAISAGVEERRVRLAEQQGSLLATVIQAILRDLDLSPEQAAKVSTVVPRHLRAVVA
jgi:hypothetical protein